MTAPLSRGELIGEFASGAFVGDLLVAGFAKEFFGHTELAHSATAMREPFASAARLIMIGAGTSPNDLAAGHRKHHLEEFVPDGDSIDDGIRFAASELLGVDIADEDDPSSLLIPGVPIENDRLFEIVDSQLRYQKDWLIERIATKNLATRAVPPIIAFIGMVSLNKKLGRTHPVKRASAYFAGLTLGTIARPMATIYTEGQLGLERGNFLQPRTRVAQKVLSGIITRHEEHHDYANDPMGGLPKRRKVMFMLMERFGVIKRNMPRDFAEAKTPPKASTS